MAAILNPVTYSCTPSGALVEFTAGSTRSTGQRASVDWTLTGPGSGYEPYGTWESPSDPVFLHTFQVEGVPNGDFVLTVTNEDGDMATQPFTVSCTPCTLVLGPVAFPSPTTHRLSFTTQAGDGQARVYPEGQSPSGPFLPSPYQGTGVPGQSYSLEVVDRDGCSQQVSFTQPLPVPSLTQLQPDHGLPGSTVALSGTLLDTATRVSFGSTPATFQVRSEYQLLVIVPPLPPGIVPVQVQVGNQLTNSLPFGVEAPVPAHTEEIPGWTLSWQLDFNSWTGEHTTVPNMYLTRGKDTYREASGLVWKQTKDTYGLPLTLEVVDREGEQVAFDTLVLQQEVTDLTQAQPFQRYTTLSSLTVRTEYHHTGTLTPFVPTSYQDKWNRVLDPAQVAATFEKDQYQLELPGSVVVDVDGDITSPANQDPTKTFKPRLSGKWALLTLQFQGTPTQKYLLHTLRVVSRPISR